MYIHSMYIHRKMRIYVLFLNKHKMLMIFQRNISDRQKLSLFLLFHYENLGLREAHPEESVTVGADEDVIRLVTESGREYKIGVWYI